MKLLLVLLLLLLDIYACNVSLLVLGQDGWATNTAYKIYLAYRLLVPDKGKQLAALDTLQQVGAVRCLQQLTTAV